MHRDAADMGAEPSSWDTGLLGRRRTPDRSRRINGIMIGCLAWRFPFWAVGCQGRAWLVQAPNSWKSTRGWWSVPGERRNGRKRHGPGTLTRATGRTDWTGSERQLWRVWWKRQKSHERQEKNAEQRDQANGRPGDREGVVGVGLSPSEGTLCTSPDCVQSKHQPGLCLENPGCTFPALAIRIRSAR